jgi:hypothetical protein
MQEENAALRPSQRIATGGEVRKNMLLCGSAQLVTASGKSRRNPRANRSRVAVCSGRAVCVQPAQALCLCAGPLPGRLCLRCNVESPQPIPPQCNPISIKLGTEARPALARVGGSGRGWGDGPGAVRGSVPKRSARFRPTSRKASLPSRHHLGTWARRRPPIFQLLQDESIGALQSAVPP